VLTFSSDSAAGASGPAPEDPAGGIAVFTAFERQLGLKLEPRKIMVDEFVIDHVELKAVEN
jgi:uncharacterized protein (TIGR03435 family)